MEEKVVRHYFEERTAQDPSIIERDYLITESTDLIEAVVDCAFRNAVSMSELEDSQVYLACCDLMKSKSSPSLPSDFDAHLMKILNEMQISDCRTLSESLKSCITDDLRDVSETYLERMYFIP
ncbi:hypothetical protein RF11_07445 [Thelohanellus kitauei]|uniref:Uncharacterized protein n=1 Tax=Thelohanellus kitauei TaxID=669202 RepID=A0A0C2N955_THEKT|nr:hypothetical protein RF11_07445 [Thelohanellus kitauei]